MALWQSVHERLDELEQKVEKLLKEVFESPETHVLEKQAEQDAEKLVVDAGKDVLTGDVNAVPGTVLHDVVQDAENVGKQAVSDVVQNVENPAQ